MSKLVFPTTKKVETFVIFMRSIKDVQLRSAFLRTPSKKSKYEKLAFFGYFSLNPEMNAFTFVFGTWSPKKL